MRGAKSKSVWRGPRLWGPRFFCRENPKSQNRGPPSDAVQDFELYRTVVHRDLLGEEDGPHAARARAADKAKTAG